MEKNKRHIKKNDKVKVIAGKDNGKIGKVINVLEKTNRLLIENVNMVKRHTRPSASNKQGGIVEGEAAIHWSNVMLMCNKCIAPVRIKMQRLEDGKKVRVCRKCNEIIDA
jgi:large subunit ribosomal protein L24